jgi:hypothetical protein
MVDLCTARLIWRKKEEEGRRPLYFLRVVAGLNDSFYKQLVDSAIR